MVNGLLNQIKNKIFVYINDKNNAKLINKILYAVGTLFLLYLILSNWDQFVFSISQISLPYLLIPLILYPLGMIPTASAYHFLLKLVDQNRSLLNDIFLYSLSLFSRHIPGHIWFISSRSLIYKEENISSKNTLFLTLLETILLSFTGFVMSLPLIWTNRELFPKNTLILIITFCFLMIIILMVLSLKPSGFLMRKLSKKLLSEEFDIPSINNKNLLYSILSMWFGWIGGGILLLFVIRSFIPIQLSTFLMACGIWGFSGAVSLSLGLIISGFGIREVTIALLLSTILTPFQALTASIIFRLILILGEMIWVIVFSICLKSYKKTLNFRGN